MKVIDIGERVSIDGVTAVVVGILIRERQTIKYECSWWNGKSKELDWFEEFQVNHFSERTSTSQIGFIKND